MRGRKIKFYQYRGNHLGILVVFLSTEMAVIVSGCIFKSCMDERTNRMLRMKYINE